MRGPRISLTLAAAALLAAGCGERKSKPAPAASAPAARLVVTRDFGATALRDARVAPGQSVMAALGTVSRVETRYSGGFVQSIDGLSGSRDGGRDWIFTVDGVEADTSATAVSLHAGDVAWWDYRDWSRSVSIPVVVGAWPMPFTRLPGGVRAPVQADVPLAAALQQAGADVVSGPARLQALVGAEASLVARSPLWARAVADPAAAGLTVWPTAAGCSAWDGSARRAYAVAGCRAVIAAAADAPGGSGAIVLAVAGADAQSAQRAASALAADPTLAAGAYALALDGDGRVLARGGRPQ